MADRDLLFERLCNCRPSQIVRRNIADAAQFRVAPYEVPDVTGRERLWQFYLFGWIDLYFGDESAFSMNPKLPYGWSPKGERIKIFPRRDKKINLFGIFRPDNFCLTYESAENINSDFLIRSIDDFSSYLEKPTVLVLDNAPTHRSEKFLAAVERWMEKGLYIFFLPKYSPHLNLAETFWRKAKYEWLDRLITVRLPNSKRRSERFSITLDWNTKSNFTR